MRAFRISLLVAVAWLTPTVALAQESSPRPSPETETVAVVQAQDPESAPSHADGSSSRSPSAGSVASADGDGAGDDFHYDIETNRWVRAAQPLWWRNTLFGWDNSVSLDTFLAGAGRAYSPTYVQTFSLEPRLYLADHISIRLRQDLNWEVTDSAAAGGSVWLDDLRLSVVDSIWFTLPGEVWVGGGLTAIFPVSEVSRNCGLVTGLAGHFGLTKAFEDVLAGLALKAFGGFRSNIHSQDICSIEGGDVYGMPAVPGPSIGDNGTAGGVSNSDVSGSVGAHLKLAVFPELSFSTSYQVAWYRVRVSEDACFDDPSAPGGTTCIASSAGDPTSAVTFFSLAATYLVTDWINLSLAYSSLNPALDGSGNLYNPFYNPQSQFTLSAVVFIDRVYQGVAGMVDRSGNGNGSGERERRAGTGTGTESGNGERER